MGNSSSISIGLTGLDVDLKSLAEQTGLHTGQLFRLYTRFTLLDHENRGFLQREDLLTVPELAINPLGDRIVHAIFNGRERLFFKVTCCFCAEQNIIFFLQRILFVFWPFSNQCTRITRKTNWTVKEANCCSHSECMILTEMGKFQKYSFQKSFLWILCKPFSGRAIGLI